MRMLRNVEAMREMARTTGVSMGEIPMKYVGMTPGQYRTNN